MSFPNKRGITLVAVLMLIIFASITVSGLTIFIVQRLSQNTTQQLSTRALYLAQTGIQNALYNFRFEDLTGDGFFSLGQTNIDANNHFVVGGTSADMLMVDTSTAVLGGPDPTCYDQCAAQRAACEAACVVSCGGSKSCLNQCRSGCRQAERDCQNICDQLAGTGVETVLGLKVKNATSSQTIWIDRIIVSWDNGGLITGLKLKGCQGWAQNLTSPANADIVNCKLNLVTPKEVEYIKFNHNMTGSTVTLQFVMLDGSMTDVMTVYPASDNFNFTVKSTGKVTNSNLWRTIQARYNVLTSKVIQYNEISTEILP